jgi:hypothetical protein
LRIRKWYLDLVTQDGTVFIGYSLHVRWAGIKINCAASLISPPDQHPVEKLALQAPARPHRRNGIVNWNCRQLGVQGTWRARARPLRRHLHRDQRGRIDWLCHQPVADCTVTAGDRTLRGSGYVEELRLSLAPWRLDIDQLSWGRFISRADSLVWIQWEGAEPLRLTLRNGRPVDGDLPLVFGDTRTLRAAELTPVLRRIPVIGTLVARKFGETFEHKLLSRATLLDKPDQPGWAIHETVNWPVAHSR